MMANNRPRGSARCATGLLSGALLLALGWSMPAWSLDLQTIAAQAKTAAAHAYQPPRRAPKILTELTYDQYRAIHFKPSRALWPNRRFHVQFFAPGYLFTRPVEINIVDAHGVHRQPFKRADFDTDGSGYPRDLSSGLGFAGFRLHYNGYKPNSTPAANNDEVVAFLGASYFRAKAAGQEYGVSARGLAINTIAPGPEEFPVFREFWIRQPAPDAKKIVVYALLDSRSATGAFRFTIAPGTPAKMAVRATLFLRRPVHQLGLAPLSSMYFYGMNDHRPPAYLRPAVHDSQGLLIEDGQGRWLWRQLTNPKAVYQYAFRLNNPKGFGLMQRNRDFFDYQSPSMNYQARPSIWIQPGNDWGKGQVTLVEIPSPNEVNDNIAVFWSPRPQPLPQHPIHLAYAMTWGAHAPKQDVARVQRTLSTRRSLQKSTTFRVDFAGGALAAKPESKDPQAIVDVGKNGKLTSRRLRRLDQSGVYRLAFTVRPVTGKPIQLRAYLARGKQALTETWDYVVTPETD